MTANRSNTPLLWLMLGCAIQAFSCTSHLVTIDNVSPKLDQKGSIVNAHDGTYRKFGDYWYYHGAEYGLCNEPPNQGCDRTKDSCGFHNNHNVSIWRSKDLSSGSWEFRGHAALCDEDPGCEILYRPHLVYNPITKLYVLIYNYVGGDQTGHYMVKTSASPEGPFQTVGNDLNVTRSCKGSNCGAAQGHCGDFDIFVDEDGSGYIILSCGHWMSIEKLTRDFLHSTGQNASTGPNGAFGGTVFEEYFVEAPVMFKRNDIYYAMFGHCCCYCYQGSGIMVYTAVHPMGPWIRKSGNRACVSPSSSPFGLQAVAAEPTPGQGCLYNHSLDLSTVRSQQNFVIEVPGDNGQVTFVWTGDRWQQAPDGLKGHDPQYWAPLKFTTSGDIHDVVWINNFTLSVAP